MATNQPKNSAAKTPPLNNQTKNSSRPKAAADDDTILETEASPLSIEGLRSGVINHFFLKAVMFLLIAIFAVGFLFTSLNPGGGNTNPDGSPAPNSGGPQNVALVGDDAIERTRYEQISTQQEQFMQQFGQKVGPLEYFGSRQRTLQSLIENTAQVQAARGAGFSISDTEIQTEITRQIDEQIKNQKSQGEANFRRDVEARFGSVEKYRAEMQTMVEKNRDDIERSLLVKKLEKKIKDATTATEADYQKSQTKLKLRQIVIRPKLAPAGDKTLSDKNKSEAKTKADKIVAQLKTKSTPQAFAFFAKSSSDDFATKTKGGDLGWKLPAELPVSPASREAVLKSNGKIVGPVIDDTSGDVSIFMVEARGKFQPPKDYGKNKTKLIKDFETQRESEAWQKYQTELGKTAKSEISDPALQAYKIQTEGVLDAPAAQQNQLRNDALVKYEEGLKFASGIEAAAIRYQMAQLYRDLKQPKKAVEVLKTAASQTPNTPQLSFEYARALRDAGDKKTATSELQKISKELDSAPPAAPSMFGGNPNDALRFQVAGEYDALGRKDLAAAERKKIPPPQMGGGMPGGMMMPGGGAPGGGTITIPPR